jgi:tRNA(fMet)-specific endonuclease VapC
VILLLDTNTCIYLIKEHPPEVLRRFNEYTVGDIGISSITTAELHFGVQKSQRREQNRLALQQFLLPLTVAHFDENAASAYGHVRAHLEKQGTPIGSLDTLIVAHALSLDLTLVTNNVREFERVRGLKVENWVID